MPTMDFEVYLDTNAPAAERATAFAELLANEDAAGIEYAVVMPMPTRKPSNRGAVRDGPHRTARHPVLPGQPERRRARL